MEYYVFFVALSFPGGSVHKESKEMATHSSILAWEIPRTEEPGGLQSMRLQRVGHDLANKPPLPYTISW